LRSTDKATLNELQEQEQFCSESLWLRVVNCGARKKKLEWYIACCKLTDDWMLL